jgi:hypothetical protein
VSASASSGVYHWRYTHATNSLGAHGHLPRGGVLDRCVGGTLYTFDALAGGTTTTFTDTSDGVTATFSSPDGAVFFVTGSFFASLTGNVLFDVDAAQHALDVEFSSPESFVSLLFALNGADTATLTLEAFLGGTLVGSVTTGGAVPIGFGFPEGAISFSGAIFDAIRLTSTAADFAIDDVALTAVPEPATVLLLTAGLAGAAFRRRRATQRS